MKLKVNSKFVVGISECNNKARIFMKSAPSSHIYYLK